MKLETQRRVGVPINTPTLACKQGWAPLNEESAEWNPRPIYMRDKNQ